MTRDNTEFTAVSAYRYRQRHGCVSAAVHCWTQCQPRTKIPTWRCVLVPRHTQSSVDWSSAHRSHTPVHIQHECLCVSRCYCVIPLTGNRYTAATANNIIRVIGNNIQDSSRTITKLTYWHMNNTNRECQTCALSWTRNKETDKTNCSIRRKHGKLNASHRLIVICDVQLQYPLITFSK